MFVTNIGDNVLYRNRGTGSFVETNNRAGVTRGVAAARIQWVGELPFSILTIMDCLTSTLWPALFTRANGRR